MTGAARSVGIFLGICWTFGIPLAFIVVEVLAVRALGMGEPLAWWLAGIVVWNVWVLWLRLWRLAQLTVPAEQEGQA